MSSPGNRGRYAIDENLDSKSALRNRGKYAIDESPASNKSFEEDMELSFSAVGLNENKDKPISDSDSILEL